MRLAESIVRLAVSGGTEALLGRKTPTDRDLRLVYGRLGQTVELEGGGRGFPDQLRSCILFGVDGLQMMI